MATLVTGGTGFIGAEVARVPAKREQWVKPRRILSIGGVCPIKGRSDYISA